MTVQTFFQRHHLPFTHLPRPLKLRDLMDDAVSMAGALIAGAFALAILVGAVGLVVTSLIAFFEWLGW